MHNSQITKNNRGSKSSASLCGDGLKRRLRLMCAALAAVFAALPALAAHSEVWTYNGSGTGDPGGNTGANYDAANAWKDANGTAWTFDTAATVARDYIVPAGKTLVSHKDTDGNAGEWRFTANDDTFILRGSSTAVAHLRHGQISSHVSPT